MTIDAFEIRPPDGDKLTDYDERHLSTYLRLLDAADEGADWREAVRIIFGLDPIGEPQRARIVYARRRRSLALASGARAVRRDSRRGARWLP
jgi:hypothetical protein